MTMSPATYALGAFLVSEVWIRALAEYSFTPDRNCSEDVPF